MTDEMVQQTVSSGEPERAIADRRLSGERRASLASLARKAKPAWASGRRNEKFQ
jgi:hypothetical protein